MWQICERNIRKTTWTIELVSSSFVLWHIQPRVISLGETNIRDPIKVTWNIANVCDTGLRHVIRSWSGLLGCYVAYGMPWTVTIHRDYLNQWKSGLMQGPRQVRSSSIVSYPRLCCIKINKKQSQVQGLKLAKLCRISKTDICKISKIISDPRPGSFRIKVHWSRSKARDVKINHNHPISGRLGFQNQRGWSRIMWWPLPEPSLPGDRRIRGIKCQGPCPKQQKFRQ